MTYDLRRLRRKGFIQRSPHSHHYVVTPTGRRMAFFFAKTFSRILQPGLQQLEPSTFPVSPLAKTWRQFDQALSDFTTQANLIP